MYGYSKQDTKYNLAPSKKLIKYGETLVLFVVYAPYAHKTIKNTKHKATKAITLGSSVL